MQTKPPFTTVLLSGICQDLIPYIISFISHPLEPISRGLTYLSVMSGKERLQDIPIKNDKSTFLFIETFLF